MPYQTLFFQFGIKNLTNKYATKYPEKNISYRFDYPCARDDRDGDSGFYDTAHPHWNRLFVHCLHLFWGESA